MQCYHSVVVSSIVNFQHRLLSHFCLYLSTYTTDKQKKASYVFQTYFEVPKVGLGNQDSETNSSYILYSVATSGYKKIPKPDDVNLLQPHMPL